MLPQSRHLVTRIILHNNCHCKFCQSVPHREDSHSVPQQSRDMCLITVVQGPDMLKLHPIFHFNNTRTNLLLPRKNDSMISFIRVYMTWQYQNLIEEDFLCNIFIRNVNTKILQRKVSVIRFHEACQYKNLR